MELLFLRLDTSCRTVAPWDGPPFQLFKKWAAYSSSATTPTHPPTTIGVGYEGVVGLFRTYIILPRTPNHMIPCESGLKYVHSILAYRTVKITEIVTAIRLEFKFSVLHITSDQRRCPDWSKSPFLLGFGACFISCLWTKLRLKMLKMFHFTSTR